MIRENCGTHSITLLFSFMCGSLLSLIYLIPNVPFRFAEDMPVIAAAASFNRGTDVRNGLLHYSPAAVDGGSWLRGRI